MGYISWYLRSQRGKRNTVERGMGETRRAKNEKKCSIRNVFYFSTVLIKETKRSK